MGPAVITSSRRTREQRQMRQRHVRLLLQLAERACERDDLGISVLALGRNSLEAALVVHVTAQDLFALCGVHAWAIGRLPKPL